MVKILGVLLGLAGLLAAGGGSRAAETVRFNHVRSIYVDDKGDGMREPEGVACTDRSTLIVADTGGGRLLRYTLKGRDVEPAGVIRAAQLAAPIRVALNSRDEVFVLDGKSRRILRFAASGAFEGYLEPRGVPAPPSIVPRSLTIDGEDRIYLLDVLSARVLVLGPDGTYQRHLAFPPGYGFFSDLAVDGGGSIYLLDSVRGALYVARKGATAFSLVTGDLRKHLSFATSMVIDPRGVLYLVDQHGGGVVRLAADGAMLGRLLAMGRAEGLLYYPSQMCLHGGDLAFIADRGNSRVQEFSIAR